jgi:hypothetical protein
VVYALSSRLRVNRRERYSAEGIAFSHLATVTAYRVSCVIGFEFRDQRRNAVLWKESAFTVASDSTVQGAVSDTIAREIGATGQVAEDIGRRIANTALERF